MSALSVVALVLGSVGLGAAVGPSLAVAAGVSCKGSYKESTVSIGAKGEVRDRIIYRYSSGTISYGAWRYEQKGVALGGVRVLVGMCKSTGSSKWNIVSARATQVAKDVDMTVRGGAVTAINPVRGPYGHYLSVRKVTSSAVTVEAVKCTKAPERINVLKLITSVPVPGPYPIAVGQWIGGLLLPKAPAGKAYCGALGSKNATLRINSTSGVVTLDSVPSTIGSVESYNDPCSLQGATCTTQRQNNVYLVKNSLT